MARDQAGPPTPWPASAPTRRGPTPEAAIDTHTHELDAGVLAELKALDALRPGTLGRLVTRLSASLPSFAERLRSARAAGDPAQLAAAAHALAGAAASLGLARAAALARALEGAPEEALSSSAIEDLLGARASGLRALDGSGPDAHRS